MAESWSAIAAERKARELCAHTGNEAGGAAEEGMVKLDRPTASQASGHDVPESRHTHWDREELKVCRRNGGDLSQTYHPNFCPSQPPLSALIFPPKFPKIPNYGLPRVG